MKLQKGKIYKINIEIEEPTRVHQSGFIAATKLVDKSGDYEYIGRRGHKYYFYSNEMGYDIYLTKDEYLKKISK